MSISNWNSLWNYQDAAYWFSFWFRQIGIELKPVIVDVHQLVDEALNLLRDIAAQRNITIHLEENRKPLIILADQPLLGHVVDCARKLQADDICVVYGFGGKAVKE